MRNGYTRVLWFPVLDHDAVELHGGSGHTKLERTVRVVAVALDLVVVDFSLDLLGAQVFPRRAPLRADRTRCTENQQSCHDGRESMSREC